MCGGSGTRLWPLSTPGHPKQFHRIGSNRTLFQQAVERLAAGDQSAHCLFLSPAIIASVEQAARVGSDLKEIGVQPEAVLLEPMPMNTAPAIAAASLYGATQNSDDIVIVLPSDQLIQKVDHFREVVMSAVPAAIAGKIVTFGIVPDGPETGYGYIEAGNPIYGDVRSVASFKEKPDLETAKRYVQSTDYSWNAGIFMFRTDVMLDELRSYHPETVVAVEAALSNSHRNDGDTQGLCLDAAAFSKATATSIDYAVMEKSDKVAVMPADIGWSDVGSWSAVWDVLDKDGHLNATDGPTESTVLLNCEGSLAMTTGPKIAAYGVKDLVIVATDDGVLVVPKDKAQHVKDLTTALQKSSDPAKSPQKD